MQLLLPKWKSGQTRSSRFFVSLKSKCLSSFLSIGGDKSGGTKKPLTKVSTINKRDVELPKVKSQVP